MLHDRDYMRSSQSNHWMQWLWSDAVTILVSVNVLVYVIQLFFNDGRPPEWGELSLSALAEGKVWTLFTHMFLHAGLFHILGNALGIFFVGKALQSLLGTRKLLYVYFCSGLGGAILEMLVGLITRQSAPMVGASGCVFGLLLGLAVMLPQEKITAMLYFVIPIRMKLWNLAMLFMGVSVAFGLLDIFNILNTGIAHFAHIGGGLTGWWFVRTLGYGGGPVTYERLWQERQQREQSRELAGVRRRQREGATRSKTTETWVAPPTLNTKEFIEREIDPILEKIAAHGIGSLTEEERALLQRARNEIMNRDSP